MERKRLKSSELWIGRRYGYYYEEKLFVFTLLAVGINRFKIRYKNKEVWVSDDDPAEFFELPLTSLEKELV